MCAEQDIGNLKKCTFRNSGTHARRTTRRNSQKTYSVRNSGAPVRRTRRQKSKQIDVQEFWGSCAQNKTSDISKNGFQELWGSCALDKKGVHLKPCTFRISGTHVRRTERRKSQKYVLSGIQVTKTNSAAWGRTFLGGIPPLRTTF